MPQPPRKTVLPAAVQLIGEAETRREVILIGLAQGAAGAELGPRIPSGTLWGSSGAEELLRCLARQHDLAVGEVEREDIVVQRVRRSVVFLAQAIHQGELRVILKSSWA